MRGSKIKNKSGSITRTVQESKSQAHYQISRVASLEYIWPSSIPDSWKNIMKRQHIKIRIRKTNRDTMEFLQETQKYIGKICKPPDEVLQIPRKSENFSISLRNYKFPSNSQSPNHSPVPPIQSRQVKHRPMLYKYNSKLTLGDPTSSRKLLNPIPTDKISTFRSKH